MVAPDRSGFFYAMNDEQPSKNVTIELPALNLFAKKQPETPPSTEQAQEGGEQP